MIELGLWTVQVVIGLAGLVILATVAFLAFILVFGGLAKVLGIDAPKIKS